MTTKEERVRNTVEWVDDTELRVHAIHSHCDRFTDEFRRIENADYARIEKRAQKLKQHEDSRGLDTRWAWRLLTLHCLRLRYISKFTPVVRAI